MKTFFVRYWGEIGWFSGIQSGLYAVRAANREDCAQFILRWWKDHEPNLATMDMIKSIREKVAEGKSVNLHGKFNSEKMVDDEQFYADE